MTDPTIDWLYGLRHRGIKLGLDNIRALLRLLDHPERAYRIVHVAGTNGKGSVAAMLDAMLACSGIRSGMFTSPHLVRPNERVRIGGADIGDRELSGRLSAMRDRIETALSRGDLDVHPSFFEVITALSLQTFRDHELQTAVLEVGLGGRLDATNAVGPDVCVIVGVGLDHTKTLGGTLAKIAGEKAGIVKPDTPLVSGATQQCVIDVLRRVCLEHGAPWVDARQAVRLTADDGRRFALATPRHEYRDLQIGLAGRHQIDNARVALAAFELLMERMGRRSDPDAVRDGLARVRWPGRLQRVEREGGGPVLLLDAAHNPAGMRALVAHLRRARHARHEPPVLLFGATGGKPLDLLLAPLAEFTDTAVLTSPSVERGIDPDELMRIATALFERAESAPHAEAALARAGELAGSHRAVLVTGSLYLIGEILGLVSDRTAPGPVAM